jgi:hypothetical protein
MSYKQDKLYAYNKAIMFAKIDGTAKSLLYFYANVFNWTEKRASFYSQRHICAFVGMSQSTYQIKRKYLEELGWIKVKYRGRNKSCEVTVLMGLDDPNYETQHWAKWHPTNEEIENFEIDLTNLIGLEDQLVPRLNHVVR